MAQGHPSSCAHATIGSVCHCECSGVRHSVAINGGIPAPASAKKGAKGTPTADNSPTAPDLPPAPEPPSTEPEAPTATEPDAPQPAEPEPGPPFDERIASARSGAFARQAAPHSLERPDDLTEEQRIGLHRYRGARYEQMNLLLRGGTGDDLRGTGTNEASVREWIDGVDSAMAESPIEAEVQTWRGMTTARPIFGDRLDGDLTGAEWTEDAYVSTTTNEFVAAGFSGYGDDEDEVPVQMRLVVPRGVRAIELSTNTTTPAEEELLLDRGLRMRVVADHGIDPLTGRRMLDVEVFPPT